jgi:hypothetical protein
LKGLGITTLLADVVDEFWTLQLGITGTGASPDVSVTGTPENVHSYMTAVAARFISSLSADILPEEDMEPEVARESLKGAWPALWDALQPTSDEDSRSAVVQALCLSVMVALVRTYQNNDPVGHLSAVKLLAYLGPSIRKVSTDINNDLIAALLLRAYEFGFAAVCAE